jgi:hypothetical protein
MEYKEGDNMTLFWYSLKNLDPLTCLKLTNIRPKCARCESGHKTDNYGLKCSFCFGLGHTKYRCWKKSTNGLFTTTNFLEVLVDDEEATLLKLNHICGGD